MLSDLLTAQALHEPSAVAIAAPGRDPMTYAEWNAVGLAAVAALLEAGIEPTDRIALLVPNGPEAAAATVILSSFATVAPLDPGSRADELERALHLLAVTCVVVLAGSGQIARSIAARLDLAIVELVVETGASAGAFVVRAVHAKARGSHAPAGEARPGILARTSGTVGPPKLVAISNANVISAARAVCGALALEPLDRCLIVRPMFHMNAIVTIVAASLAAGAGIVCLGGFEAEQFFTSLRDDRITWFSAPPAMHREILACGPAFRAAALAARLRFIRSSSAALHEDVCKQIESLFNAPLLEGYGMSEAPFIACNPLPPGVRKIGSVGLPQDCEMMIVDDAGRALDAEQVGEVVIRGPNVASGYVDASFDATAFVDGWLRTGDLGRRDGDGYLYLLGRQKELINRGGQKFFPRDIESVLREDRSIADVVAFGMPHPTLGEEVAAAVILQDGATRSESEIKQFAMERVTEGKVPKRVLILSQFPRTPTGKVQVHELRKLLEQKPSGIAPEGRAPAQLLEAQLLQLFQDVLDAPDFGVEDDFFVAGGDSLRAVRLIARIRSQCGEDVSLQSLFEAPMPRTLAKRVVAALPAGSTPLVRVQQGSKAAPLFFLNGDLDGGGVYVRNLARVLDAERTVYALPPHGTNGVVPLETIEAMARDYAGLIDSACPDGPFLLGGYCNGGVVAYEVARILRARGRRFSPLILIGATAYNTPFTALRSAVHAIAQIARWSTPTEDAWYQRLRAHAITLGNLRGAPRSAYAAYVSKLIRSVVRKFAPTTPDESARSSYSEQYLRMGIILGRHVPGRYDGPVHHIWGDDDAPRFSGDPTMGWGAIASDLTLHRVPGDHLTMVTREADRLARVIEPLFASWS